MSSCRVIIDSKEYDGEYLIEDGKVILDVYNYSSKASVSNGSVVKYKEMTIYDLRNKVFIYSPTFYTRAMTFGLTQYEKFQTNFYFQTSQYENLEEFNETTKIRSITFYHPMLIHYFNNPCLFVTSNKEEINCTLKLKSDTKEVVIGKNNIEKIVFGGVYSYSLKNEDRLLNIETENYVELVFINPIECEEILEYIYEFDVFTNAYYPIGVRSYKTIVNIEDNKKLVLTHKLLGAEKEYHKAVDELTKLNFFDFLSKMYDTINYRESENKNKYIPLDLKKPTSMEDQFTFYFRYIDMFMGEYLKDKTGEEANNYKRLSHFIDEYTMLFDPQDITNIENLKNELNSLRNHYVHEGYYLPNGKFKVKRNREFLYEKTMDYQWLYRVTKALKLGSYKILYTKVLGVEINDKILKGLALK